MPGIIMADRPSNAIKGITSVNFYSAESEYTINANFPQLSSFNVNATDVAFNINCITSGSVRYEGAATANAHRKIRILDLHGAKLYLGSSSGSGYSLRYHSVLTTVNAKCRVDTTNTSNQFNGAIALANIDWIENAQTVALNMSPCPLTESSLVNVANGLKGGEAKTLTLSSTRKTMCDSIMGTVSSVTVGENTYDFFTADPNGTVTLTEFITITKGWTLA